MTDTTLVHTEHINTGRTYHRINRGVVWIKLKLFIALFISLFIAVTAVSASYYFNPYYHTLNYYRVDAKYKYGEGYSEGFDAGYDLGYERGRYDFKRYAWDHPEYLPYYYGDGWYDEIYYYHFLKVYKPSSKYYKKGCWGDYCRWYDLHDPDDYIKYMDLLYAKGEKPEKYPKFCYHKNQGYYYCWGKTLNNTWFLKL